MSFDPDVWGNVADWVVAATAVFGVGFGLRQLRAISLAEQDSADQARQGKDAQLATAKAHGDWVQVQRAQFLMRLDERFESEFLGESKRAHRSLRNRFEMEASRLHPDRSNKLRAETTARLFSNNLTTVWRDTRKLDAGVDTSASAPVEDKSAHGYALIMRLPYWIETVGFLVRRGLVRQDDILILYDQVIITTITNIRQHIADRADEGPHPNHRFLENAVWICERATQHKLEMNQRPALAAHLEPPAG